MIRYMIWKMAMSVIFTHSLESPTKAQREHVQENPKFSKR